MSNNSCYSGLTRRFFAVTKNLAKKRPKHEGMGVDSGLSDSMSTERFFDLLPIKDRTERELLLAKKRLERIGEIEGSPKPWLWYRSQNKTLLGLIVTFNQGGFVKR